jgi:predicted metal-dependent peptidase
MKTQLPDKLTKAINGLVYNHPFFASVVLRRDIVLDDSCKTAWTNGPQIGMSPDFMEAEDHEGLMFTFAHEVLHITNKHHIRGEGKDPDMWNDSCDESINPILFAAGFSGPKTIKVLNDPRFAGLCAEDIYRIKKKEKEEEQQQQQGNKGESFGEVRPCPVESVEGEEEKIEVETKQAENAARKQGKLPASLERAISNVPPSNDWQEDLAKFASVVSNNDYSFSEVDQYMIHTGFIFPSLHSVEIGNIVVACDTSGSVTPDEIAKLVSSLIGILETLEHGDKAIELPTIYCDSEVRRVEFLGVDSKPNPLGGGGTNFIPPFDYVESNLPVPAGLVYITDGYCNSFPPNPGYPVLWALFVNNPGFKPPFGEITYIAP